MRMQSQKQAAKFALPQISKLAVYLVGLIPAVWLFYEGVNDRLGADTECLSRAVTRLVGFAFSHRYARGHPAAADPQREPPAISPGHWPSGILLRGAASRAYLVLDQGLDFAAIFAEHREARLHHHRHGDFRHSRPAARSRPTTRRSAGWGGRPGRSCRKLAPRCHRSGVQLLSRGEILAAARTPSSTRRSWRSCWTTRAPLPRQKNAAQAPPGLMVRPNWLGCASFGHRRIA